MDIENIIRKGTAEIQREVEILIAEVVRRRQSKLWHTVAHHRAVGITGLRSPDNVAILVIHQPFAIGGVTGITPHIEIAKRLAFFNALKVVVGVGVFCAAHVVIILTHIL